ncbi:MAG: cation transporter [Alphaproteobacteria bacterium]
MKKTFILEDLDCANCAAKIENAVAAIEGVVSATVSFMTQKMTVEAAEEDFEVLIGKIEAVVKKVDGDITFRK